MNYKTLTIVSLLTFLSFDAHTHTLHSKIIEVATHDPDCKRISPFYLEIADKEQIIISEQIGDSPFKRETVLPVASASKWIFAGYVVDKLAGDLNQDIIQALTMRSGHTQFQVSSCIENDFKTVEECAAFGNNSLQIPAHKKRFYYNNGHQQALAISLGLGGMDKKQLSEEINHYLNLGDDLDFNSMQLGGGMSLSVASYAHFLSALLRGDLKLAQSLGSYKTCTWGDRCPQALYSPVELPDSYSIGHWVESLDGAYSSAGLFGFYPWIDSQKRHYGIISRFSVDFSDGIGYGPGYTSMLCGQAIRQAIAFEESLR
jgi:hypothetical protein